MNITMLIIVLIFIAFDVLTGWLKAIATKTANSSIMRKGLFHKLGEIIAIIFGYVCEYTLPYLGVQAAIPFAAAIGTYIVLMEIASIVENIAKINPSLENIMGDIFSKENFHLNENEQNDEE